MSLYTYNDSPDALPEDNAVTAIAVNHRRSDDVDANGAYVSRCGHPIGWPDKSLTELPPECVAAGCKVGYLHESYRGMVAEERERNMHDDSDFYATVWNRATGELQELCWGSTRGWTYFNGCKIDLSAEDRAAYEAMREENARKSREDRAAREAAAAAKVPSVGRTVVVKSTRSKVPHGTTGEVFWFGKSSYAPRNGYANPYAGLIATPSERLLDELRDYRVGIRLPSGEKVFCAASAVEVVASQNETEK